MIEAEAGATSGGGVDVPLAEVETNNEARAMANLKGKDKPLETLMAEADIEAEVVDPKAEAAGEAAAGATIILQNVSGAAQRDTYREIAEHLHI
ncbi:unnamed protein product [Calypogeia fissa]